MSEFLGSRISLISRSDIRYVGILHEINSTESTVSLENVKSFGTEGRKANTDEEEVPPNDQIYEYIVFRGTDVKDLRIEEGPSTVKENKPPAVPNDPAIVGARARPGNVPPPPHANHQAPPGGPGFGYYPPQMGGWGRGGGPGPGPGPGPFGGMQYPPPAGWFPPGQGFPPPGPAPWNNYQFPGPGGPPTGPPAGPPGAPGLNNRQVHNNQAPDTRPIPIGATSTAEKKPATPAQQSGLPSESRSFHQAPAQPAPANAPPPPVDSKPTTEEVKATAASLSSGPSATAPETHKSVPTGPKGSRPTQILPAVPLPMALTARPSQPAQAGKAKASNDQNSAAATAAALRDATQAAKAAVAVAMAKFEVPAGGQQASGNAMDNLTKKVNEMRVNAARTGTAPRGGRGRGPRPAKVEVPEADFDFASSNAKFIKQDLVNEAVAGSPLTETSNDSASAAAAMSDPANPASAYNKSTSFFDNISSEAKDRADNHGQKPGGREWRGEEQRKNMETFGQGSVDGGYRGGYRGRNRGRGGRGRGFGRGGRGGGYRNRDAAQTVAQ